MVESLSVIIPTHNRRAMTVGAVRSVLAQTLLPREIIVVDDGSTDGAGDLIHRLFPAVTLIRQEHQGVSAARNLGIRQAASEFIAFLDSDDLFLPNKCERQILFLRNHPSLPLVHSNEHWLRNDRYAHQPAAIQRGSGDQFRPSLERCVISPSSVMIRKRIFDEIGLFNEAMPACEDYDLWLRITARFSVGYISEPLLLKRGGHPDQISRTQPALDYWRIAAITNLLRDSGLTPEKREAALDELEKKCHLFSKGRQKRSREDWRFFDTLPARCRKGSIPPTLPPL